MREFPNATPRPWEALPKATHAVAIRENYDGVLGNGVHAKLIGALDVVLGEIRISEEDRALIVHAVNTYEERERLLEEAAYIFRTYIEKEHAAWKPVQVFRTNEEVSADETRHDVWTEVADDARAFLAKLDARDE